MNVEEIVSVIIGIFIFLGALLHLLGTVGLIRFPDVYNRMHAVSKSATLGVLCILVGATCFLWMDQGVLNVKLLLGILFVFITSPVGGHLITRAAYRTNVPLWEKSVRDDLAPVLKKELEQQKMAVPEDQHKLSH